MLTLHHQPLRKFALCPPTQNQGIYAQLENRRSQWLIFLKMGILSDELKRVHIPI